MFDVEVPTGTETTAGDVFVMISFFSLDFFARLAGFVVVEVLKQSMSQQQAVVPERVDCPVRDDGSALCQCAEAHKGLFRRG